MQVQHETHLIESGPLRAEDFNGPARSHQWSQASKCLDFYVLISQSNSLNPIEHIACSSSNNILAVVLSQTNQVNLYDTRTKNRVERFPLKACDKKYSRQSFHVSGMSFSPDGLRLAISQTDCIVYIYKLPAHLVIQQPMNTSPSNVPKSDITKENSARSTSSNKPTITGKFTTSSPVTCLIWCELGVIFGGQDGKVRLISSSSSPNNNQAVTLNSKTPNEAASSSSARVISVLFASPKNIMPILLAYRWPLLCIGFVDATIELFLVGEFQTSTSNSSLDPTINELTSMRRNSSLQQVPPAFNHISSLKASSFLAGLIIIQLPSQPILSICCASSDGQISFYNYNQQQQQQQQLQLATKFELKEDVQSIDYSHINEVLVVATKGRLYFIKFEQQPEPNSWRLQGSFIELTNVLCLTKVCWLRDGTQLALGCSNGALELFRCSWSKQNVSEQLDICHIARNRIRITDRERNLLATYKTSQDIKRVNLLDNGQSVIVWTNGNSVLLARLGQWTPQQQSVIALPVSNLIGVQLPSAGGHQLWPKFYFEPSGFVFVYVTSTRELQIIRLGENAPIYSVKFAQEDKQCIRKDLLAARQYPWPVMISSGQAHMVNSGTEASLSPTSKQQSRSNSAKSVGASQVAFMARNSDISESLAGYAIGAPNKSSNENMTIQYFAYVQSRTKLVIIDLGHSEKREIYSQSYDNMISLLEFSHTGMYLICRIEPKGQLQLIELLPNKLQEVSVRTRTLFNWSNHVSWIPSTDSMIVQQAYKILVWYDLTEPLARAEEFDIRKLNPNLRTICKPNLFDLSCFGDSHQNGGRKFPILIKINQEQATLSNGQNLQFDKLKVSFYSAVAANEILAAANIILNQDSTAQQKAAKGHTRLLGKLAWLAINKDECELALWLFSKLEHKSMCQYLSNCLGQEDIQRCQMMLAKLCGDWDKFEQLAADSDEITTTYRRMNKWLRLIEFLDQSQRYRQRDLAEQEFQKWLLSRGRRIDAAKRMVSVAGQLAHAIKLLIECDENEPNWHQKVDKQLSEAVCLLLDQRACDDHAQVVAISRQLYENLLSREHWFDSARIAEIVLEEENTALDLYIKAKNFKSALALAHKMMKKGDKLIDLARVRQIELKLATHLETLWLQERLSERRALSAIDHFMNGQNYANALKFAVQLKAIEKIGQILDMLESGSCRLDEQTQEECCRAGQWLLNSDEHKKLACRALKLGADYEQLVQVLLESAELEQAFQVSLVNLNSNNKEPTMAYFDKHAKQLVDQAVQQTEPIMRNMKLKLAEKIYIQLLERPDKAIEMYKQFDMLGETIELLEIHQPDQLESTLLQLAHRFETCGKLDEAEKCLLKASPSEWTNVVRMYRIAEKWPDAFRVARANCLSEHDPLLIQLAYWWAKSIVTNAQTGEAKSMDLIEKAKVLLKNQLGLHKQVVEFCCEAKNFQFALDLCAPDCADEKLLRRDVALKYANFLEQQHKFSRAEQVLLDSDLIELAVRMYVDNEQLNEAIRLIESKIDQVNEATTAEQDEQAGEDKLDLTKRLQDTLIDCAQRLANECSPIGTHQDENGLHLYQLATNGDHGRAIISRKQQSIVLEKLVQAQQLFLRAQRPDLAIDMYKARGLWREAVQVAQRFAPRLLEDVERALDEQVQTDLNPILREQNWIVHNEKQQQLISNDQHLQTDVNKQDVDIKSQQNLSSVDLVERSLSTGNRAEIRSVLMDLIQQAREQNGSLDEFEKSINALAHKQILGQVLVGNQEIVREICTIGRSVLINEKTKMKISQFKQLRNVSAILMKLIWRQEHRFTANTSGVRQFAPFNKMRLPPNEVDNDGETNIEQCFFVSHLIYVYMCLEQFCLQSYPIQQQHISINQAERILAASQTRTKNGDKMADQINALAEISLSLLKYANSWLEPIQTLYSAGLWQLASGRRNLAKCIFSLLVELVELSTKTDSKALKDSKSNRYWTNLADFVDFASLSRPNNLGELSNGQHQLAGEARQWMLETLIEGETSDEPSNDISNGSKMSKGCAMCMISGLPIKGETNHKVVTIGTVYNCSFLAKSSCWDRFLELAGRRRRGAQNTRTRPLNQINQNVSTNKPERRLGEIVDYLQQVLTKELIPERSAN